MKILAIIPAFNEEKTIGQVIKDIKKEFLKYDILVINDGSLDKTHSVARSKKIFLIDLPFNLGIGTAIQTGFIYAQNNNYDIAFQIDADGQHIAKEIKKIVEPILSNKADVVIGSRFYQKTSLQSSFARRVGILIFQIIHQLFLGRKITDSTSGFRAYNKKAIKFLAQYYPEDYPEPEAIIMLIKNNFKIIEVSVKMQSRKTGTSSINSLRAIYYMIKVLLAIIIQSLQKSKTPYERS